MNKKTFPIFLAFLCMGFGDAVGPFVSFAKEQFQLSNFVATLIPFVGFLMFGLLSVPMGIFQDKKGKKFTLMLGLIIALVGLAMPVFIGFNSYPAFLVTILLLGVGATTLQVAGNPIMRDVSLEGKFSRNLSLAQFVKAIGSFSAAALPFIAVKLWGGDWKHLFPIYSVAILITAIFVGTLKVEEKKADNHPASFASCLGLLSNPFVLMMVMGIFLYVGAEVCLSSGVPLYLKSQFNIETNVGVLGTGLFFLALTIGRFSGGMILNWMKPKVFLVLTSIISVAAIAGLFLGIKMVSVVCFFAIGLGFANIFPLIFSIAVDAIPQRSNELSGLMITAIAGGAIIPPIMGLVADHTSNLIGFIIPLAAIVYILWVSFVILKQPVAAKTGQ
ncbi:MAG: sugar MFS transporter [Planctomycetes bacterium]|nr:sugar MFS transporter [Planctomycetota bacterium]